MSIYRKILIILFNNLFRISLFFGISVVALSLIYTDRNYISGVLEKNDAYDRFVPSILETNKNQTLTSGSKITLGDEEIKAVINEAFPSNELEKHANTLIDAMYDWLEQNQSSLVFRIDLTESKARLAEGLAGFAVNRLQDLPLCTSNVAEIDPFSTDCQPEFISYELERERLTRQLLEERGLIDDPIITESIVAGDSEETFNKSYKDLPVFYNLAKVSPLIVLLFLTLLGLVIVFASSTKKRGYKKIGHNLIGAGASLIIFTFIFSYILPEMTGSFPLLQTSGSGIDSLLNDISIDFGRDYSNMIIKISIPLILVGTGLSIYANKDKYQKNYKQVKSKSGVSSSNEQKKNTKSKKSERPPIQSSETSASKPLKKTKNKKYRRIPKKEI